MKIYYSISRVIFLILVFGSGGLLTGCGQSLNRDAAATSITKAIASTGYNFTLYQQYNTSPFAGPRYWSTENQEIGQQLLNNGYITETASGPNLNIQLTDKGKQIFTASQDAGSPQYAGGPCWVATVCTEELVEVTGIAKQGDNAATVEYSWKWHLTPLGEISVVWNSVPLLQGKKPGDVYRNTANFTLFDNGWRM